MEKPNFDEAVKMIAGQGGIYKPDGYHFLREALDHTVNQLRKDELIEHRHVSGPELLSGIINYALYEFGSMAVAVLDSWGITTGEDIGWFFSSLRWELLDAPRMIHQQISPVS